MFRNRLAFASAALLIALSGCSSGAWSDWRPLLRTTPADPFTAEMTPYERGKKHFQVGHLGLALQSLRTALAENPDSVETLNAIAATYDRLGRFDLAGRYYRRALSIAPRSAQTLNNMGYSFMLQGRLDDASQYLERARALNEVDGTIAANLTIVQRLAEAKVEESPATVKNEGDGTKALREAPRVARIERVTQKVQILVLPPDSVPLAEAPEKPVAPTRVASVSWKEIGSAVDLRPKVLARLAKLSPAYHGSELKEARIEVSNGAGRRWMAARSRAFLTSRGVKVRWLTNAKHFNNMVSVIFHRDGFREQAEMLARLLRIRVRIEAQENQRANVRLRLGGDLLDFDRELISIFGRNPYYASARPVIPT